MYWKISCELGHGSLIYYIYYILKLYGIRLIPTRF